MPTPTIKTLRLSAAVLTLIILALYSFLPPKIQPLHPLPSTTLIAYSDEWDKGNSSNVWQNRNQFTAQCILREGANYRFCGIAIKFYDRTKNPQASDDQADSLGLKGVDLSGYSGIKLRFDYQGNAERIRFALRNVEFDLTQATQLRQAKQLEAFIEASEYAKPIYLDFDLLNISDWWVTDNKVHRQDTRPAFNNVMEIILHFPSNTPLGEHTITIKEVTAYGRWVKPLTLYRSIVVFWVCFLLAEALWVYLHLRREKEAMAQSLNALKNEYDALKTTAQQDSLTNTLNRHGIETFAAALLNSGSLTPYWLCLFDIDNFKSINNAYGNHAGDAILTEIITLIKANIHHHEALGRWAGEEFMLISAGGDRQEIFAHCEKLRKTLGRHTFRVNGKPIPHITLSFGITRLDMDANFEHSFKKADKALQSAKSNGHNQVALAAY